MWIVLKLVSTDVVQVLKAFNEKNNALNFMKIYSEQYPNNWIRIAFHDEVLNDGHYKIAIRLVEHPMLRIQIEGIYNIDSNIENDPEFSEWDIFDFEVI